MSVCALAAASWHVQSMARLVASRVDFPGDICWLEGHSLEEGRPIGRGSC